jgi:phage-related protein
MSERFEIELLPEAAEFLGSLDTKARENVLFNMRKARVTNDAELLKKLTEHIWEFRTQYAGLQYRFLAFWVKRGGQRALVIATHGFSKKTQKTPSREMDHAMQMRNQYLKDHG